ncbi:hypothetical protein [Paraflavitalea speifideaquila]|uniref:tRNA ligase subunit PheS family protein n=1 Tax=Paraflavitalea speifideaquila TaxID=3076558 RepID=UPI0028E6F9B2|nr:hypothetical protein [Paraflavitalea speifideiaquila]
MEQLLQQIAAYKKEIEKLATDGADALEAYRIKFLGTKGIVKNLFTEMKNVAADKRKEFGLVLNEFKQLAESKYDTWKEQLEGNTVAAASGIDVTLPGDPLPLGTRHPINLFLNHVISIFQRLGFSVAEGPEIEDDWHNFTALNLPEHHPARDMQDTFYIQQKPDWLLRTHTSNTQIRAMEQNPLPIRIICPGRVYRNETVSARSHCFSTKLKGSILTKTYLLPI